MRIHWLVGRKVTAHNARGDAKLTGVVIKVAREEGRGQVATLHTGHSVCVGDILSTEPIASKFYVTTYCNNAHSMASGRPIGHECRHIPPAALRLERGDCVDAAISYMQGKVPS